MLSKSFCHSSYVQWLMIQVSRRREQSHVPQASRARGPTRTQDCPVVPLPWRRVQTKPSLLTTTQNARTTQCFPVSFVKVFSIGNKTSVSRTNWYVFYFLADGTLYCIHTATSGGSTYLTLYNADATVDNSATFQFVCMVRDLSLA